MSKVESKEMVPKLRFPEFRGESEWGARRIEEFLTESRIKGNKGDIAKKITVKLWGKGVFEKNEGIKGSVNTQYYWRNAGQFIYSKLDFLNEGFGIIPDTLDGFESTVDLPCFDIREGLNSIFLLEYVKRKDFYKKFGEIADGGRKAKRIQTEVFLSFLIIIPPTIDEQQKIANCLTSLDNLITAEIQKLDTLKEHKQGLMQQMFPQEGETIPKLRFSEFSGDWENRKIIQLAKVKTGNKDTMNKVNSGLYPFYVRSQAVECINSYSYDGEAILTSGDGVGVGKNFHYIIGKFDFHQRVYVIYDFNDDVSGKFVYFYFSKHFYKRVMALSAKNSVDSVRRAMITEMPIKIPDIGEQQKITDCLTSLDNLITSQIEKIETLKFHKKGLMQQLFPSAEEVGR